ncbi:hypothetical protein Godav_021107 [Gossypium davidsonii]|uniref:RNase H type-1 domain-containing protein n=2 Tax=Gossypium TaxID=3633 RepID=A0A7J8R6I8_GOSDV|nr:hypothetical protein [Gossypium davidsonii]MBA0643997.1 hypothetical protein [Gossypium klotzschianum]
MQTLKVSTKLMMASHFNHEGVNQNVYGVVAFMKIYMQELESLEIVLPQCQKAHNIIWELPIRDTMKVHFDATFHQLAKKATLVILVKNKEGLVMATYTYPYENTADSTVAEARACLTAIIFMEELGFWKVVVEGDALTVVKKLKAFEKYKSIVSVLIKEIKVRLIVLSQWSLDSYIVKGIVRCTCSRRRGGGTGLLDSG